MSFGAVHNHCGIVIDALIAHVVNLQNRITELEDKQASDSNEMSFVLEAICEEGWGDRMLCRVKSNPRTNTFTLNDKERHDLVDYFESNGY